MITIRLVKLLIRVFGSQMVESEKTSRLSRSSVNYIHMISP